MNKLNLFFIFAILVLIAAPLAMASGSVVITPNPANTQSTLTCTVTVGGSGYTYAWSRNGAATGITGAYVQPGYLYAGDTWTCKVTKYYPGGIGWVTIGSDSRYINAIPVNNPPSAQITSPANWAAFTVGTSINFVGSGWDSEDGVLSGASLQWYVDGVNFGSGNSFNYAGLSVGQHQITLIATDSGGLSGSTAIMVVINPVPVNNPPTVQITSPANGASFIFGTNINFAGTGSDPEDGALSGNSLRWFVDGVNLFNGNSVNYNGLSVGTHTITLNGIDSQGLTGTASITITITPVVVNNPPVVNITAPANGTWFFNGTMISFTGTGVDVEDGVLSGNSLRWLFDGVNRFNGTSVNYNGLSVGNHTITLNGIDSQGLTGTALITIHINSTNGTINGTAPVANITAPANGSWFFNGTMISFTGTGVDVEDGVLSGNSLRWLFDGVNLFNGTFANYNGLSVGAHTITLNVIDSTSLTGTASITININSTSAINVSAPVANITAPTNGTSFLNGTNILFTGTGFDLEDGILLGTSLRWYLDGINMFNGSSFSYSGFAAGTHNILLNVIDSTSLTGTASITININSTTNGTNLTNGTNGTLAVLLTANPIAGNSPLNVTFNCSVINGTAPFNYTFGLIGPSSGSAFGTVTNSTSIQFSHILNAIGNWTASCSVTDAANLTGNDTEIVAVLANGTNQVPFVDILAPPNGTVALTNGTIVLTGYGFDPEDGTLTGNSLRWFLDGITNFANGTSANLSGLTIGTHTITLNGTDSQNATAVDSITVIINATNGAPVVYIILPANGSSFNQSFPIFFQGNATDPEEGAIIALSRLNWTSNRQGLIGNGEIFTFDNLTPGVHIITLTAWDMTGNSGSASITITINATNHNPNVTIIRPANNTNFTCGQQITFEGSAFDIDNDSLDLRWFSGINGLLGTGNLTNFASLNCSATHLINFTASDGRGGYASDSILINILPNMTTDTLPNGTIISPVNASRFINCQVITFNATAADAEGLASVSWESTSFNNQTIFANATKAYTSTVNVPASQFGIGNHTVLFRVVDTNGHQNLTSVSFEVAGHTAPTVAITMPANNSAWNLGTLLNFSAAATPTDICPTNFSWIWRDNGVAIWNTSSSFSSDNLTAGNHTITAYITDDYAAPAFDEIVIHILTIPNILPTVQITSPVNGSVYINPCQSITFTSNANDTDGNVTEYQWIWNSNIINDSANFTLPASYFGNGNQTVRLQVRDNRNGVSSATVNFMVIAHVAPTITITAPANGTNFSAGAPVTFTANAVANDVCPVNLSYEWSELGIPMSNLSSFTISNLSIGQHTVVARTDDTLGLFDTDFVTINILAIPNIPPVINSIVCYNSTGGNVLNELEPITCIANANDTDGNITSWVWSVANFYGPIFSNNTFNVPYPYLINGTYNVSLTVQDDDLNQTTLIVPITVQNNAPVVTLTSNVTTGIEPLSVLFTCSVTSGNKPYSYAFNFGNGVTDVYTGNETSVNFTINYPQNGTYNAVCSVTDVDGDLGNATQPITVIDTIPQGDYNFTPQNPLECTNVYFTSNVTAYDGILSYFWSFMDGGNSTLQNPAHNFTQNGNYNVALTVSDMDNSPAFFNHLVNVQDTVPLVEAGPDRNVTEGNNLTFVGSAIRVCDNITGYEWNFGDGTPVQTGQLTYHNFSQNGTYFVTFTAIDSDGSRASDNLTVVVYDTVPDAVGFVSPNPVMEGSQATLNASQSTGYDQPLTYQWNINGTIIYGVVINYTFPTYLTNNPVIVPVVLTVTDADGSTDNATIIVVVLDSVPTANATLVTPNPIYEGDVVTFDSSFSTALDLPMNYTWYFGDGNVTTTSFTAITHVYVQNATYLVRLVVTDADGSTDDAYLNVNVLDTVPTVNFNWVPPIPFEGTQVNFTDLSTIPAFDNITAWLWDFGDGNTSNIQNATHTYKYNGTYNVTLYVKDFDDSVWTNLTRQITVANYISPMAFSLVPSSGNELLTVLFNCTAAGNNPFTFVLEFGDGTNLTANSNTGISATKQYLNGTYNTRCTVVDNDGDTVSLPTTVVVNDLSPNASLAGNTTLYEGQTGIFNASNSTSYPDSIAGYEWDWDYTGAFNADQTSITPVMNHTFYIPGTFTVAVRVVDTDSVSLPATLVVNVINLPPTVAFVPASYTANESENVTFAATGSDPGDGFDAITYQWDWDYNGTFTIDESTLVNTTVHTWPDDFSIPFMVAVRGVDSYGLAGNVSTALVKINNVPPVPALNLPFYVCNNDSLSNSSTLMILANVNDPGADTWDYLWNISNSSGVTIEQYFQVGSPSRNANITFNCGGKPLGLYNVTLNVKDDDHGAGITSSIISVTNGTGNNPPTIVSPSEGQMIAAAVATPLTIPVLAFDSDGDSIALSNNASLAQTVAQAGGILTANLTYLPATPGLVMVALTACDNSGYPNNCSTRNFIINVTQPNIPPTAVVIAYAGQEGVPIAFNGSGSFDTDDTVVTWMWDFGDGTTQNTTVSTTTHTYADNASYLAVLRVIDSRGAISLPSYAGVSVADVAPLHNIPLGIIMNEDSSDTITVTVSDVAADYPITLTGSCGANVNSVITKLDNSTFNITFSATPNWNGNEDCAFIVGNKDAKVSVITTVVVVSVNDIPEVNSILSPLVIEDSNFSYHVIAMDNDTTDILSYLISAPAGMTINSTGWINWTPNNLDVGSHSITVYVTDGNATTQRNFTITVTNNPTQTLNCPATYQQATAGSLFTYDLNSTDEGVGDVFTLRAPSPAGLSIIAATGVMSWTPTNANLGLNAVNVQVNDTHGAMPSCPYFINVSPMGTYNVSISANPASQTLQVNTTASYSVTIDNLGSLGDSYSLFFNNVDGANLIASNITLNISGWGSKAVSFKINSSQNGTYNVIVTVVSNTNAAINASVTVPTTFTSAPGDTTAPVISGVGVNSITNTSATVIWNTNENANASVNYGTTSAALGTIVPNINFALSHTVPLSGLQPNTTYYYNVTSCDASGNCATFGTQSFTTLANGIVIPPVNITGGSIINSTIYGGYYANNSPSDVTQTPVSNTTSMLTALIQGTPIVQIKGTNVLQYVIFTNVNRIENCTAIGTPSSPTILTNTACVNQYIDPSNIVNSNTNGTLQIISSNISYSNATYNLIISGSTITYSTVNNSRVYFNSIIDHSVVKNSWINFSTIMFSNVTNSDILQSIVIRCSIVNSDLGGSVVANCQIINSTAINSTINDSVINDSDINNSDIDDSNITNCTILNSNFSNAECEDDTIINATVNDTDVCYGIVNGVNLGGICVKKPVITLSVPSSAHVSTNVGMSGTISNNQPNYTYVWGYGDSTGATSGPKNETSDYQTKSYASTGTYDVSLRVLNKYNVSATAHSTITITSASSPPDSGHSGSGGGSAGPTNSGILKYQGKNVNVNIASQCKSPQTSYVDSEDVISFKYNGTEYTIKFTAVTNKSVDLMVYPLKIPVTLLTKGSTIVDVNDDGTDDVSIILNDIVREVDAASFVRHRINMTLKLVNCQTVETPKAPVEAVKEAIDEIKTGVLDVIGNITPSNKASPVVGSAITAGIIAVGLGGYFALRRKKPKL